MKEFEKLVGFYKNANIPEYSQERCRALFCRERKREGNGCFVSYRFHLKVWRNLDVCRDRL